MINPNVLLKVFVFEYIAIALAYAFTKDWARLTYFIGAAILSVGVLWMK